METSVQHYTITRPTGLCITSKCTLHQCERTALLLSPSIKIKIVAAVPCVSHICVHLSQTLWSSAGYVRCLLDWNALLGRLFVFFPPPPWCHRHQVWARSQSWEMICRMVCRFCKWLLFLGFMVPWRMFNLCLNLHLGTGIWPLRSFYWNYWKGWF